MRAAARQAAAGTHQVLLVLLRHVPGVEVPLHDLAVCQASEQHVLLVGVRVQLDAVRHLARRDGTNHFARLSVPPLDVLVVRAGDEAAAVVAEADVLNRLRVPHVRAHALAAVVHIPDLHLVVHASRQQ
jgi:hypothetical protein